MFYLFKSVYDILYTAPPSSYFCNRQQNGLVVSADIYGLRKRASVIQWLCSAQNDKNAVLPTEMDTAWNS